MTAAVWAVLMSGCASGSTNGDAAAAAGNHGLHRGRPREVTTFNDICPISGRPIQRGGSVAFYKDLAVGFCSPECVRAWITASDAKKRKLIAGVSRDPRMRVWGAAPRNPFR